MHEAFTNRTIAIVEEVKMRKAMLALVVCCTLAACTGSNSTPPLGPVVLSPASANLSCAPSSTTFTAAQSGFSGTFTASSADTTNETVAAGPGTNQFTVTRVGSTTSTPVNITVIGGGSQSAVFTANNVGCICMRHHDMWNAHLRATHTTRRR
jgi:ethanolamine utilization protein EutA (predicted chaperonin)